MYVESFLLNFNVLILCIITQIYNLGKKGISPLLFSQPCNSMDESLYHIRAKRHSLLLFEWLKKNL